MPPAARLGDLQTCPMAGPLPPPPAPPAPHVGGPILPPCAPTVLIGGQPAARATDQCLCSGQPNMPNMIAKGSATVMIVSLPAARLGDPTMHGGQVTVGCPTVMIGG